MHTERKQIAAGTFLTVIPADKFKSNYIQIRFVMPLKKETAAKNSLVFPVILRGTEKYPTLADIRRRKQELYASGIWSGHWKHGDNHIVTLEASSMRNSYAIDDTDITGGVLDLIGQAVLHPVTENGVFKAESVEGEKKIAADTVRATINQKGRYARLKAIEEMFSGDAYGISDGGTVEEIEAVCPKCLFEAYKNMLRTARIEIFAVGDFDGNELEKKFSEIFSSVERDGIYEPIPDTKGTARAEIQKIYDRQNVTQGVLVLGFFTDSVTSDDDYAVTKVFNTVFGGSAASKLFMSVREKLSLCYYCSSSLIPEKGAMTVASGIQFENEQKAFDEIMLQLDNMKNGEITDDEIEMAKKSLCDDIMSADDSVRALAATAFGEVMYGRKLTDDEKIAKINAVTKEQITERAKAVRLDTYYFLCGQEESK